MAVVEFRRTKVAVEPLDHQWKSSTPPVTGEPVWEATVLAVECRLVYLVREKPTAFRVLDRPMVVYHHRGRASSVEGVGSGVTGCVSW